MKKLLLMLAVLCGTVSAWAEAYRPGARTTTIEAGKKYFISVATWYGSGCTNLLYNNGGTLAKSDLLPNAMVNDESYLFSVEEVGDGYLAYIKNSTGNYIQADNLTSTVTKTGVYVIPYFTAKAVCCGDDVDACDENGNKIAYANITAETPIVTVQKNSGYTVAENRNGWRYIGNLSAGVNWCTAFAFYEAKTVEEVAGITSGKVYRIINKANAGKTIFEKSDFLLGTSNKNEEDKSQMWYVEGDNVNGYTLRNLNTADYFNYVDQMYTHWGTVGSPVKFFIGKAEEKTDDTPDYFYISYNAVATPETHAFAHYSNGNIVRWCRADKNGENYTNVNPSLWQFEEVSVDEEEAFDAAYTSWYTGMNSKITEANNLITTSGYSVTPVELTVENVACPAAISDNSDGGGVSALLDEDNETFMHTKYSGKGSVGEPHYIQVDLGEDKTTKYISFSYRARHNNQSNNPETIIIKGSVDGQSYEDIQTLTNLPDGLIDYTSNAIGNGKAYRYFRFVVTETTNNSKHEGYVFFSLAKFRMSTVSISDAYVPKIFVFEKLAECLGGNSYSESRPAEWTLFDASKVTSEIEELIYGCTLRTYPFTLTTDVNNPECYQILSGRQTQNNNPAHYFTLKPQDAGKVKLESTTKNNIYSYWFFMEDPATGMLMVVPFMDEANPLGYTTIADGADKLTNVHSTDKFAGYYYEVIDYAGIEGFPYALKPYNANTNVSNYGGTSNFMGFYSGTEDAGTAVKFEPVATPALEYRLLLTAITNANSKCPGADRTGTMLNGYSEESVNAYKSSIATAEGLYDAVSTTTAETLNTTINTLNNLYSVLAINLPENGKFYRLRCTDGKKYLQSTTNTSNNRLTMTNNTGVESYFTYYNGNLISYTTGKSPDHRVFNEIGNVSEVIFSKAQNGAIGCYNIKVGANYIYGSGSDLDSGTNPDNRNGYNWWLEPVTTLPVTITSAGYATFYAPVAVTLPEGLEAYYVGETTNNLAKMTLIDGVIPANTGVILKGNEGTYDLTITTETSVASVETNLLSGTVASAYVEEDSYVLSKQTEGVGFYKAMKNFTVAANGTGTKVAEGATGTHFLNNGFKAYLPATTGAESRFLVFNFGDDTETAIEGIEAENTADAVVYDLAGRRVQKAQKGLYIVNGKKVIK